MDVRQLPAKHIKPCLRKIEAYRVFDKCMIPAAKPQTELIHRVVSVALFLDLLVTLLTTLDYLRLDTLDWLP